MPSTKSPPSKPSTSKPSSSPSSSKLPSSSSASSKLPTSSAISAASFVPYTPPSGAHITPVTSPIEINSTPLSQTFRHLQPLLLLAHFYLRFPALVADPARTLLVDIGPLVAAQVAYCVICLPVVSGGAQGSIKEGIRGALEGRRKLDAKKAGEGQKKTTTGSMGTAPAGKGKARAGGGAELGVGGRISTALLAHLLTLLPSTPLFFIGTILLGAPLTTHHLQTFLLALHLALLSLPPLFYTRGVDARAWRETAAFLLPFDEVWGRALGAVLGAWLGAVPIPLDWDREWQKWPVTIVVGGYVGWGVGRVLGEMRGVRGGRVSMAQE